MQSGDLSEHCLLSRLSCPAILPQVWLQGIVPQAFTNSLIITDLLMVEKTQNKAGNI
jgi:hypothetical protein